MFPNVPKCHLFRVFPEVTFTQTAASGANGSVARVAIDLFMKETDAKLAL
jgi:hypothetical protein